MAAVALGGAAGAAVTLEDDGFFGGVELEALRLGGEVFGVVRHKGGAHAAFGDFQDFVGEDGGTLPDLDDVAGLDGLGGLGVGAGDLDFVAVAGVGGVAPGLEHPDRPEVFVYSNAIHSGRRLPIRSAMTVLIGRRAACASASILASRCAGAGFGATNPAAAEPSSQAPASRSLSTIS